MLPGNAGDAVRRAEIQGNIEGEVGDLLFTVVNLGTASRAWSAEMALRGTNARFRARFREMERVAPKPLSELGPEELEALWAGAKRALGQASPDAVASPLATEAGR